MADVRDRTRYLLVSHFGPGFTLYYDLSDGMFPMNDPASGTLFKRRNQAVAVQKLLGEGITLVRCRADTKGNLVVSSLPSRYGRTMGKSRRASRSSART